MPKKPYFESAIHHLLLQAKIIANQERVHAPEAYLQWERFINSITFVYKDLETIKTTWTYPKKGTLSFSLKEVLYYSRGDTPAAVQSQKERRLMFTEDKIKEKNDKFFSKIFRQMAKKAGLRVHKNMQHTSSAISKIDDEEKLSDLWALSVNPKTIDIHLTNTACTSPELRYIHQVLGDIKGMKILDLGCGLGEPSVYFALHGAKVTAVDLSQPMLDVLQAIAKHHKVSVKTKQTTVENLNFPAKEKFDIVYVGNVFHHVNIDKTLSGIVRVMKPDGKLICWEPLGYNPAINIYRRIATKVRSHEERPFKTHDIDMFRRYFGNITTRYFWFSTLLIFVVMALIERRDPNKERYWKVVIKEADKWKPLYTPLEALDRLLLRYIAPLRLYCWNICLICEHPLTVAK